MFKKTMLRIKNISEILGKSVYTSDGDFFGQIEEVNLAENKIDGWKIKVGNSFINIFGGARGVVVPHQFVKAIGDIFIINKTSLPMGKEENISAPAAELESFG